MKEIYVKLLDEGTIVYRPVPVLQIEDNLYKILGHEIYDSNDETWEFTPDTIVQINKQLLSHEMIVVAAKI